MNRFVMIVGLMFGSAVLLAQAVIAQRGGRGGGGPGGAGPQLPLLTALDADGDGELSAREIDNASASLRTLDKNKDGKLTRDEFLPGFRERGPGGQGPGPGGGAGADELVARMMALDKNGDGKLGADELPERMRGVLARADTNKDGYVDKNELTRLAQQQAGRRQGPGRGGPRPREAGDGADAEPRREQADGPRS